MGNPVVHQHGDCGPGQAPLLAASAKEPPPAVNHPVTEIRQCTLNLASAHQQGLADFEAGGWWAFALPKDTPTAIVQKLHDVTVATMETS